MLKDLFVLFLAGFLAVNGLLVIGVSQTAALYFGGAIVAFGLIWVEADDEEED